MVTRHPWRAVPVTPPHHAPQQNPRPLQHDQSYHVSSVTFCQGAPLLSILATNLEARDPCRVSHYPPSHWGKVTTRSSDS